MINAQLNLIILVFNVETGKYKLLSKSKDKFEAPNMIVENQLDVDYALEHLLSIQLDHNGLYHNFKLTDISINDDLDIYYLVFITHETTIKSGYLLELHNPHDLPKNAQKIIRLL